MPKPLIVGLLLIASAGALRAVEVEVETLDGATVAGELTAWSADAVTLRADGAAKEIPRSQLLAVAPQGSPTEAATPTVWLQLADGSTLQAKAYAVVDGKATLELIDGAKIEFSARLIDSVRFNEQDENLAKQWAQIRALEVGGDLIVIRKDNALDHLEGVLRDVSTEQVQFQLDADVIPVRRTKVEGLIYYRAVPPQLAELGCVVQLVGGQRLQAQSVSLVDDGLKIRSRLGPSWTFPLASVSRVDYSAGKLVYLSDLEPASVKWTPFFESPAKLESLAQFGRPRFDQSLEGGALRLGKKTFAKGLALRSRTELSYRLPGSFRTFTALAGIDDRVGDRGHVRLLISGDDKPLLDTEIAGGEDPRPIEVDISGVRRLKIVVDYGEDLDVADHLDLCNARISK
jgi:hypothetical protein